MQLRSSVYLYPTKSEAEHGGSEGATGFILSVRHGSREPLIITTTPGEVAGLDHCYLVTNKHVAAGTFDRRRDLFARAMTYSDNHIIVPIPGESWCFHPESDVAVAPVSITDYLEPALFFKQADQVVALPYDALLTKEMANHLWVGPGDDVFMMGRLLGHEGRQKNLPSLRFGHISTMPDLREKICVDDDREPQEGYLIEGYSYSGYSGSPVILSTPRWEAAGFLGHEQNPRKWFSDRGVYMWLLGICFGHLSVKVPLKNRDGFLPEWVTMNSGMACVVPAWKILEVLNSKELADQREEDRKARNAPMPRRGAVPD